MKLLIIVLCLLSERFLVHASAHTRFDWFKEYQNNLINRFSSHHWLKKPWVMLFATLLPLIIASSLVIYLFDNLLFGFVGLLLNLAIFHYCLGPNNPFYPQRRNQTEGATQEEVGAYLANANGQLFSVIFWYVITGPIGLITYRVIALSNQQHSLSKEANYLTALLEWLPAKITSLLYLLVGNFQAGIRQFARYALTPPNDNQAMLMACGLQAVNPEEDEEGLLPQAETIVEHALIVLLVFLALFTIVAWL